VGRGLDLQHDAGQQQAAATVIARETRVEGQLSGSQPVRIEGTVKGTVHLTAPLEIAEGASLEADVVATVVRVAGSVVGNITASKLVELLGAAHVKGDVAAPALHVVEGANLEGRVVMQSGSGAPGKPAPPAPQPAKTS
jgi:cytoskeletal protein CcmA (bactofilin family)